MKPLQPSEISYIIQAKIEGKTVQEILKPDPFESVVNDIQRLYEQALHDGLAEFSYEHHGDKFTVPTKVITDLNALHNINAVREIALAVMYQPDQETDGPL
jgi:hypothetical protein